jgi:hypothetical protein
VHCKFHWYDIDLEDNIKVDLSTAGAGGALFSGGEIFESMRRNILAVTGLLALLAPPAFAEIWECTDQNGNKRFTNIKSESKGCRLLDVKVPNTMPGTRPPAKVGESPKNFPKVDGDTQRGRDAERRRILEQELANEQKLLDEARKDLADQESQRLGNERNYQRVLDRLEPYKKKVKLHEDNIANLRRELAGAR